MPVTLTEEIELRKELHSLKLEDPEYARKFREECEELDSELK